MGWTSSEARRLRSAESRSPRRGIAVAMDEQDKRKGPVDLFTGERTDQGGYALDHRAQQGKQRVRSCERHDMDVMAGLQTQQGLRSVAGEALMEGDRSRWEARLG